MSPARAPWVHLQVFLRPSWGASAHPPCISCALAAAGHVQDCLRQLRKRCDSPARHSASQSMRAAPGPPPALCPPPRHTQDDARLMQLVDDMLLPASLPQGWTAQLNVQQGTWWVGAAALARSRPHPSAPAGPKHQHPWPVRAQELQARGQRPEARQAPLVRVVYGGNCHGPGEGGVWPAWGAPGAQGIAMAAASAPLRGCCHAFRVRACCLGACCRGLQTSAW